jgi:hypothetical protein
MDDHTNPRRREEMYEGRRGAPWLPALVLGGLGAALISKRARWHAAQHGYGHGPSGPGQGFGGRGPGRGLPPKIEEMLDAWHKRAHGETAPSGEQGEARPGSAEPGKTEI